MRRGGAGAVVVIIARCDGKEGRTVAQNVANESETHTNTYSLTVNQATPLGDLKLIGAYRDAYSNYLSDYDGSEVRITEFSGLVYIHQWSAEATLTGKVLDDRLSYVGGLFSFKRITVDSWCSPFLNFRAAGLRTLGENGDRQRYGPVAHIGPVFRFLASRALQR